MQKTCLFIVIAALTCWACHKSEDLADPINGKKSDFSSIKDAYEDGKKESLANYLSVFPDHVNDLFVSKGLNQSVFCHAIANGQLDLVKVLVQQEKIKFNDEICNIQGFQLAFSPMVMALYFKNNDILQEIFDAKLFNPDLEQNFLVDYEKIFFGKNRVALKNSSLICYLVNFSLTEPFNLLMKSKAKINLNAKCNLEMPVAWLALAMYKTTPNPIQKEIAIGLLKNPMLDLQEEYHGLTVFQYAFELKDLDLISVFYDRGAENKIVLTNKVKISAALYVQNHPAEFDQKFKDFFAAKAKADEAAAKLEDKKLCPPFLSDLSSKLKSSLALADVFDKQKLEKFFKKAESMIGPAVSPRKSDPLCAGLQYKNVKFANCKEVFQRLQICAHLE